MKNQSAGKKENTAIETLPVSMRAGGALLSAAAVCLAGVSVCRDASLFVYILPFIISLVSVFTYTRKTLFRAVSAVMTACVALFTLVEIKKFTQGAKLFANRLFTLSEESQSYIYQKFEVDESAGGISPQTVFALAVIFLLCVLTTHATIKRVAAIPAALCVIYAEAEIYLGIAPNYIVNILTFIAWFLLIALAGISARKDGRKAAFQILAVFTALFIAVSGLVYAVYPPEYRESHPAVQEVAEKIRDWLEDHEKILLSNFDIVPPEEEPVEAEEEKEDFDIEEDPEEPPLPEETPEDESAMGNMQPTEGSPKGKSNILLWLILAFLLLLILAWVAAILISRKKREKKMQDEDIKQAIHYIFTQGVKWLRVTGFESKNVAFLKRVDEIREMTSDEFAYRYEKSVETWEKALYSNETPTEEERRYMMDFYNESKRETTNKISMPKQAFLTVFKFM